MKATDFIQGLPGLSAHFPRSTLFRIGDSLTASRRGAIIWHNPSPHLITALGWKADIRSSRLNVASAPKN